MSTTINELHDEYVSAVGQTLENDRYFQYLFEMVRAGENTIENKRQVLHKVVDERWIKTIEDSLDSINKIIEKPRRFITTREEVVPVALARKITADSVRHLSRNTQFIASSEDGNIQPTRILNVSTEETYDLYENRFIYHLIQRLVTFIDKRTDIIFWSTADETRDVLNIHSKVDDAYEQIEYKIELSIKNNQSFSENDSDNMSVFMRIDRLRRMVMALRQSSFCSIMQGCSMVRSPIQRTNLLMKDPDYRTCYKLWQFLETYEEVGYTIDVRDSALEFDEEYQIQMFSNLITNYTVFKSLLESDPRKLEEAPAKRRKVIKPKFLKRIEEQIVDSYDIPDVEVRKVIIQEVTQAQLDAEARLEEETALREAAEAARMDAEQAFEEYRWQAQFQQAEQERQAEDRLNFFKEKAEKERQELQTSLEAAQKAVEEQIAQAQEAAARQQEERNAAVEATRQEAAETLAQERAAAERQRAELEAAGEAARQAAAETLEQTRAAAAREKAELEAAVEAARREAEAQIARIREEAARQQAELQAAMEDARHAAEETLAQAKAAAAREQAKLREDMEIAHQRDAMLLAMTQEEAEQRRGELQAALEAAQKDAEEARAHGREITAALKRTENALQAARQARDNAIRQEQGAQRRAEEEAALRQAAEAKVEENKLTRRILDAMTQRRGDKNS